MTYNEAFELKSGDVVKIKETGEQRTVMAIDGTLSYIFVISDTGRIFSQDQITKEPVI